MVVLHAASILQAAFRSSGPYLAPNCEEGGSGLKGEPGNLTELLYFVSSAKVSINLSNSFKTSNGFPGSRLNTIFDNGCRFLRSGGKPLNRLVVLEGGWR